MNTLKKYVLIFICLLVMAGCNSDDDTQVQTDYFPIEIEFSTSEQVFKFYFEYNNLNQIKKILFLIQSELPTPTEYELTANYKDNRVSSLVFKNVNLEEGGTYMFEHDDFGIITGIQIELLDGETYEVNSVYSSFEKIYTLEAGFSSFFPLTYYLDESGNVYSRFSENSTYQYKIKTIDGQKGIFHALPQQLELYLFFELSYFSAAISYFFSPNVIEQVYQKPSPPYGNIQYSNYEYDENGNPVNFNYVDASLHAEYRVRYAERPIP